jgi:hypothetical protein
LQEENTEEIWEDVIGYSGLYKVSNLGRVKRLSRSKMRANGRPLNLEEKMLDSGDLNMRQIAEKYSVGHSTIGCINKGHSWN